MCAEGVDFGRCSARNKQAESYSKGCSDGKTIENTYSHRTQVSCVGFKFKFGPLEVVASWNYPVRAALPTDAPGFPPLCQTGE